MPLKTTLSSKDAMERSGATTRQLYHWHDKGLIRSIKHTKNTEMRFDRSEVKVISSMVELCKLGLTPTAAEKYARQAVYIGGNLYEYADMDLLLRWSVGS